MPEHVDNYVTLYKAVTGRDFDKHRMIEDSERVYNFQRVFNLRRGYGTRKSDAQPFRAAGPVTIEEYESRAERYDKQLLEQVGFDPTGKSTRKNSEDSVNTVKLSTKNCSMQFICGAAGIPTACRKLSF